MYKAAMEQNGPQWLGAPSCLRGSFAFYKSISWHSEVGAPGQVWRLGGFYFVRCGPQEPVCIAEVTLLWEDQAQRHLLASSRLYFLPEDTPKGRTSDHGEDEVLAVSKRIVVRVADLAKWACSQPPSWTRGCMNGDSKKWNNSSFTEDLEKPKENTQVDTKGVSVRVLSYPQYCRYRSLQRRVQELGGSTHLLDPHLKSLEEIRMVQRNTCVLYCREIFNHPTLDTNASILTQLGFSSIRLKGRPPKRRSRYAKALEQLSRQPCETWEDRMNENVQGGAEQQWRSVWPNVPERQLFLDQLFSFMERRGSPISKVPNLGFKKIDLFLMYSVVKRLGGYENVTNQRLWKTVYNELGGSPGSTSAATCTRRHYEKLMLAFEESMNTGCQQPKPQVPIPSKPMRGRPPLHLQKQKKNDPAPPPTVSADGVVVRRGRGRPPGRRKALQPKQLVRGTRGRPPLHAKPPPSQGAQPPPLPTPILPCSFPHPPPTPLLSPPLLTSPPTPLLPPLQTTPLLPSQLPTLLSPALTLQPLLPLPAPQPPTTPLPPPLAPHPPPQHAVPQERSHTNPSLSQVLFRPTANTSSTPSSSSPTANNIITSPAIGTSLKQEVMKLEPHRSVVPPIDRPNGDLLARPPSEQGSLDGTSQASPPVAMAAMVPGLATGIVAGSFGSSSSPTVFSPIKGMCPLDLFRARLGLGTMTTGSPCNSTPVPCPPVKDSLVCMQQARHTTPTISNSTIPPGAPPVKTRPPMQHLFSGSITPEEEAVGQKLLSAQSPLPPLRILPLELDCSMQVRQLMRGNLGSEHVQSFAKRLSEALTQDLESPQATTTSTPSSTTLSPTPQQSQSSHSLPSDSSTLSAFQPPPLPFTALPAPSTVVVTLEEIQPLNLSKWGEAKRSAVETQGCAQTDHSVDKVTWPPDAKKPRLDKYGLPLKANGGVFRFPLFQDQPADLSLPRRTRALLKESRLCVATKAPNTKAVTTAAATPTDLQFHGSPCITGVNPSVEQPQDRADQASVQSGPTGEHVTIVDLEEDFGTVSAEAKKGLRSDEEDCILLVKSAIPKDPSELPCVETNDLEDHKFPVNGDTMVASSHKKLTHVAQDQADTDDDDDCVLVISGEQDNNDNQMQVTQQDPVTLRQRQALSSVDKGLEDNDMEMLSGEKEYMHNDDHATANREQDCVDFKQVSSNEASYSQDNKLKLASVDPELQDEHMQLSSGGPDIQYDHCLLTSMESGDESGLRSLTNGQTDHLRAFANGEGDKHAGLQIVTHKPSAAHDNHKVVTNGDMDIGSECKASANGELNTHNSQRVLSNSGESTMAAFISLILPNSPPNSLCSPVASTLLS